MFRRSKKSKSPFGRSNQNQQGFNQGQQQQQGFQMGQGRPMGQQMQQQPMGQARNTPIAIPNAVGAMPIQLTGLPMLQPHGVLDVIAASNCLVVVQAAEPFEMMTGIETPNRYTVHDMFMRPILQAQEVSNAMACQMMGNSRSFNMIMTDLYGMPFMESIRQFQGYTDNLMTAYPPGNVISTMSKAQSSNMFAIGAVGCTQQIYIQAPLFTTGLGNARFPIMTQNQIVMGEIVRLYPGYLQEAISDADTFLVHFPVEMPVHIKLTLLSAVFLIDFQYFEKAQGTPRGVQAGGIGTPGFHGFY